MIRRFILRRSLIGSSQHELTKRLSDVLASFLQLYSSHCLKDPSTFADFIHNFNLESATTFLCSFDINNLFTNMPLYETIGICADVLYRGHLDCTPFPEDTFREMILITT